MDWLSCYFQRCPEEGGLYDLECYVSVTLDECEGAYLTCQMVN
jgi:hypothetical protein